MASEIGAVLSKNEYKGQILGKQITNDTHQRCRSEVRDQQLTSHTHLFVLL